MEPWPNSYEVFLPPVWLSPLWVSCHFFFPRGFSFTNWIFTNFNGIHSFSSPVETRAKVLPQHSTSSGFHYEVNISLKYTGLFNSDIFLLSIPFSLEVRKFKVNKAFYNLFLGVFSILFCLLNISFIV